MTFSFHIALLGMGSSAVVITFLGAHITQQTSIMSTERKRKVLNKYIQWIDVASGEFAKYDPGNLKYQSERCKVMIEGKTVINNVISRGLDITCIPVLQICGTELYFLAISLVAPGLYVGNEISSFSLINTIENFKILPDLTRSLLEFQSKCVNTGSLIDENIKTTERAKGSTKGPKYNNRQEAPVNNKKKWIRSNWVVFRGVKYTSSSVPAPPFDIRLVFFSFIYRFILFYKKKNMYSAN